MSRQPQLEHQQPAENDVEGLRAEVATLRREVAQLRAELPQLVATAVASAVGAVMSVQAPRPEATRRARPIVSGGGLEPAREAGPPPANMAEHQADERRRILEALAAHGWKKVRAAQALGMPRRTFYRRLEEYEIG
jgi:transcriptional regulator of acetoin/glycerol metabolism